MAIGDFYYCQDANHCKNKQIFVGWNLKSIMTLIQLGIPLGAQKKIIQFVIMLHIFVHGQLMLEYELLKELFLLLKVKNTPLKHLSNNNGWQITKPMHDVVLFESSVYHFKS
jgi:hypothetical protein